LLLGVEQLEARLTLSGKGAHAVVDAPADPTGTAVPAQTADHPAHHHHQHQADPTQDVPTDPAPADPPPVAVVDNALVSGAPDALAPPAGQPTALSQANSSALDATFAQALLGPGQLPGNPTGQPIAGPPVSPAFSLDNALALSGPAGLSGAGLLGGGSFVSFPGGNGLDWMDAPRVSLPTTPGESRPSARVEEDGAHANKDTLPAEVVVEAPQASPLLDVLPFSADLLERGLERFLQGFERVAVELAENPGPWTCLPWVAVGVAGALAWEVARRRLKPGERDRPFFAPSDGSAPWLRPVLEDGV
jgi:hypothetical protein